jgi:transcriptional regulator with XRE-family HTH domain
VGSAWTRSSTVCCALSVVALYSTVKLSPMQSDPLSVRFGQRIRELRDAKGWSQDQLADVAGLHRTHISLIENAKREIQLDTVEKLAAALAVEPAELFRPMLAPARSEREQLDHLFPALRAYQELATRHGIDDVFQDNGGKLLQTLILLDLQKLPRREGNDATDASGNEYELKTLNVKLTHSFSTHHHLNPKIVKKYREVTAWFFSVYEHIELIRIYRMAPAQLEPFFTKWEKKWRAKKKDLNNPKVPLSFVEKHGQLVYPASN